MKIHLLLFFLITICLATLGFQLRSCQPQDDRKNVMSPDVRADIVYFFKKDISSDEINEFQRTVTGIPNPNSSGYSSLPGVMSEVMILKGDFRGEALQFKPNATDEQRHFVKKRIEESPLVYKVYENVVPAEIKDL